MKSVGETMSIGRTFKEALQKALRSLEIGRFGLGADGKDKKELLGSIENIRQKLIIPTAERAFYLRLALQAGIEIEEIYQLTKIDRWFLSNIKEIVDLEKEISSFISNSKSKTLPVELFRKAKEYGFSDVQLAYLTGVHQDDVRALRKKMGIEVSYKLVDTCAAEFDAYTPYYYSTYETEDEVRIGNKKKVMILGGGPNRIGHGIEFDYCCVHASFALKELGFETIMVNCNPETVSTDYDTSDKLFFEPLTREDVLNIVDAENPDGTIVQLGGQTPLNLAIPLKKAGVKIIGTTPESIDIAEDREKFKQLLDKLHLQQPQNAITATIEGAKIAAKEIGYPVIVRPSYVLGGRAMEIVYDDISLDKYVREAAPAFL